MNGNTETGKEKGEVASPAWLNVALLEEALLRGGEENLGVTGLAVRGATASGDNYGSVMYRVTANLRDGQERSFIVKVAPAGEMGQFVREARFFRTEGTMLRSIIPEMETLLHAAAPGRFSRLAARCPLGGSSPEDFLVMEDLTPQGFRLADRHKGLGLRHSLLALRTLARFHAGSAAVLERNPSAADGLINHFKEKVEGYEVIALSGLHAGANVCRKWPGFEEYSNQLDAFKSVVVEKYAELHNPKPGAFNVVIHGDFHSNNMLFRYEDGEPRDVRLVDLQGSHVAPAVLDILYLLNSSLSEDVSQRHIDLLLREYHCVLAEAMELLGLQPPSLEALLADMDSHGAYSLFALLGVLPYIRTHVVPDVNAIIGGDLDAAAFLYEDPAVKRWLQRLIPEYSRRGWLPS